MGAHSSTTMQGSTGNIGIVSYGGFAGGRISNVSTGSITFTSQPGAGSTVANATGKKLRVFYHKKEVKLEDLLDKDSKAIKRFIRPNEDIIFIDLPQNDHLVGPSVEEGFASVLVADPEDDEVYVETISLNFQVPDGACCIVTAKNEIKFRKNDGGVWIDEDGHDHST